MNHAPHEAVPEHRLPAAQSQGFAHVSVVSFSDPYSTGPLGAPQDIASPDFAALAHGLPRAPLAGCSDPAAG